MMGGMIVGLGTLIVGLSPSSAFTLALFGIFVSGVASSLINGPLVAVMQDVVPVNLQGRVFAAFNSGLQATTVLGLMVAGPVTDLFGPQLWFVVGGFFTLLTSLLPFFIPSVKNIENQQQSDE